MPENLEQIKFFYEEAFRKYAENVSLPEIEVRFYPYIGINHTIRVRDKVIYVRIAELCRSMPLSEQKALAYILVAKLLRKKVSSKAREIYSNYIKSREIRAQAAENRRARGRKIISSARGDFYDLDEIFDDLNQFYFRGKLVKPTLSWSARKTYRVLGHHDSTHSTIIVSKSLDDAKVPEYVVAFVVFHEMLHIFHPTEHRNGRRYNHTPQFRRNERKFAYFAEAENWIERNLKHLKKKAKRK